MYVVQPTDRMWFGHTWEEKGRHLPDGFTYTSENNQEWLDVEGINRIIATIEPEVKKEK